MGLDGVSGTGSHCSLARRTAAPADVPLRPSHGSCSPVPAVLRGLVLKAPGPSLGGETGCPANDTVSISPRRCHGLFEAQPSAYVTEVASVATAALGGN